MAAFLVWIQTGIEWSQMQNEWQLRLLYVAGVIVAAAVAYFATMFVLGWRGAEIRFALRR
jgi:hypothetical protein